MSKNASDSDERFGYSDLGQVEFLDKNGNKIPAEELKPRMREHEQEKFKNGPQALMFSSLLKQFNINPADVLLLRHQDTRAARGQTAYDLWRDDRPAFERYQSTQRIESRAKLTRRKLWASFVGTTRGETIFVGLYTSERNGVREQDSLSGQGSGVGEAGVYDVYKLTPDERLSSFSGKLLIDWGKGALAWVQRADHRDKAIVELRPEFKEPEFPGYLKFITTLSEIDGLPGQWVSALRSVRGIYLLTCPKTREQYVGSASGVDGFWGRWQSYVETGHGGNQGLKSRDPSDYQVSILEVVGTSDTDRQILELEQNWKAKLQSREMGLNHN